jgi:hypothetical protein
MSSDPPRPLAAALRDAPGAASLLDRWTTAQAVARVVAPLARTLAPGLDLADPGRCELRDGVLRVTVGSAAEAAKLRQAEPRFVAALAARGFAVYGMKTRVQAGGSNYPGQGSAPPSSPGVPFTAASADSVDAVRRSADAVHAPALAGALARLADTLAQHATRSRR